LFDKDYAENILWIQNFAEQIYRVLFDYYNGNTFEYMLGNVKYGVANENGIRPIWQFDSLKSAIDILFVELLRSASLYLSIEN